MSAPEPTRPRLLAAAPWLVVLAGVLVMTVLLVLATGYLTTDRRTSGAPDPAWPFAPGTTPSPGASGPASPTTSAGLRSPVPTPARPNSSPSRGGSARTTAPAARPATSAPKPPPAGLTGRYRVLDDGRDWFTGEVLVRNASSSAQSWTVELRFRDEVDLRDFWVESAPRPSVDRSDGRYVFRSGVPLPAGSSAPLRFRFAHWGDEEIPSSCTVNGRTCTIG